MLGVSIQESLGMERFTPGVIVLLGAAVGRPLGCYFVIGTAWWLPDWKGGSKCEMKGRVSCKEVFMVLRQAGGAR